MNKLKIHIVGIALIFFIFLISNLMPNKVEQQLFYISSFGLLALLSILFTLLIPLFLNIKRNSLTIYLMANKRWIGIYTFIFALIHVILVYTFLFNWSFIKAAENFYRNLGLTAFIILLIMAITSNNFSVRILGRNWKRIHYFVYLALLFVLFHAFNIGQIYIKNVIVQIIIDLLVVFLIIHKFKQYKSLKALQPSRTK